MTGQALRCLAIQRLFRLLLRSFLSVVCVAVALSILWNSGERFAGSWAGTRESALRTIAALRIIDAAELAHALKYVQEREERTIYSQGHVIDAEVQEVRK